MALIDISKEIERHLALMDAYKDSSFQKELCEAKECLMIWLETWANGIEGLDSRIPKVYSIEGRVKEILAFEEKLHRKDYIKKWEVTDDKINNQNLIKRTLTDLIGLRVNCHFSEYEQRFYDYFQSTCNYQEQNGFEFNFNENAEQKNGNKIYKFSGLYKGEYHFEVQIKSIVHNVWGEIEHRTVYKNPTYDGFYEEKKRISETLHDAMMASDRELHTLFNMKETETQLLRSLFFCKTSDDVLKACKVGVLGGHYNSYFLSFPEIEPIKSYLVCTLSGTRYERTQISNESDQFYTNLAEKVKSTFPSFYFKCLYHIDSILHIHSSYESFLLYFLRHVVHHEDDDFDNDISQNFNSEEEGEKEAIDQYKDYLIMIDNILGTRVF